MEQITGDGHNGRDCRKGRGILIDVTAGARENVQAPVDFARNFIPEELTPLYFTAAYRLLEPAHRLRYNQLQALYFNEQIVFFESIIGEAIMAALLSESWSEDFAARLREFRDDELRHSEMFRGLNRRCAPQLYAATDFHFIRVGRAAAAALAWGARHPRLFPLFIWLILLQEERSLHYSRVFLRRKQSVERNFLETYRAHLLDEAGHVRCDEELLDRWWPATSAALRGLNARLLAWLVGEFFTLPKRGQVRVVETLVAEFPELRPLAPELARQMRGLGANPAYHATLYSRAIVPRCFARFDRWPEFRAMERVLPGYRAPATGVA